MKKTFSMLTAFAISFAGLQTATSGDCFYGNQCAPSYGDDSGCCFSYDYLDVAYMSSDYRSVPSAGVLDGTIQEAPNGTIIDEMKGVDIEFRKSLGCTFFLSGEFYNTDGLLSDSIVQARQRLVGDNLLTGKRAELYYYRLGVGARHSINENLDITFEGGGLYFDCQVPGKDQDEWGWYISPGLRFCLGDMGEIYTNYFYENYENMENHRVDGGVIIPLPCSDSFSVKLGGRYESLEDKTTFLAGFRFNY
ncbi:MAG: hypothetical protein P1U89_18620 [Verrucomicrobiales bacterium]|nr:hypothetical protein [Verrucomicrobiales bacterium]